MSSFTDKTTTLSKDSRRNSTEVRLASSEHGPIAYKVENPQVYSNLKKSILSYWENTGRSRSGKSQHFPGPQPVSLERRDLFKIQRFPYFVSLKTDGMRFFLFITNSGNDQKCFMVDRAFRFFKVNLKFDDKVHENTLFDGELVREKNGKWLYLIHDCISVCGRTVSHHEFGDRFVAAQSVVEGGMYYSDASDENESFKLKLKNFVPFENMTVLSTLYRKGLEGGVDHAVDGLIFTPASLAVGTGTQYTLFKWKERRKHTFDFKIIQDGETYIAQIFSRGEIIDFASIDSECEEGKVFEEALKSINFQSGQIVECDYKEEEQTYLPLLIREDKTHPNGMLTVEKTLLNIRENITLSELENLATKRGVGEVPQGSVRQEIAC